VEKDETMNRITGVSQSIFFVHADGLVATRVGGWEKTIGGGTQSFLLDEKKAQRGVEGRDGPYEAHAVLDNEMPHIGSYYYGKRGYIM